MEFANAHAGKQAVWLVHDAAGEVQTGGGKRRLHSVPDRPLGRQGYGQGSANGVSGR